MSMASKPTRKRIAELLATSTQAKTGEVSQGNSTRDEEISASISVRWEPDGILAYHSLKFALIAAQQNWIWKGG
jgi:hypothetical protein